jgi:hypothetical protein
MGLMALRVERGAIAVFGLLSLAGALFTSLLATDTTRMFQPLFPLVALGCARFLELSFRVSRNATVFLCGACIVSSWVWQPVRFLALHPKDPIYRPAQAIALVVLWLIGGACAHAVWRRQAELRGRDGEALNELAS